MRCAIRPAVFADIPAMHAIRLGVHENRLSGRLAVTEACYRPYVAAGSAWVAELGSGIVGFAALDRSAENVWALFVAPQVEGRGVGRDLQETMIRWARRQGLGRLWLTTAEGTRAERFYLRAGWVSTGRTENGELRFERVLAGRGHVKTDQD